MEKKVTSSPRKGKAFFCSRDGGGYGGYTVAVLGAVAFHAAFFSLIALSMSERKPPLPVPASMEVSLAVSGNDTGPKPIGMEDAPALEPDQLAGDHQELPDDVFETTTSPLPEAQVDASVAVDPNLMKELDFQPSSVDTSGFDLNMPDIPTPAKRSGAPSRASQGGKGSDKSTSRGSSDGQKGGSPGNSGGGGGGAIDVPRYKYNPLPPYPARARKEAHEGTVLIAIDVDANGNPVDVKLRKSSGFSELDEATLEHVKARWKFHAAVIDGVPSASTVVVPVVFNLKNA